MTEPRDLAPRLDPHARKAYESGGYAQAFGFERVVPEEFRGSQTDRLLTLAEMWLLGYDRAAAIALPPTDETKPTDRDVTPEPLITIAGQTLSVGQAMTVRVALSSFLADGMPVASRATQDLHRAYLDRTREVLALIHTAMGAR